MGPGEKLVARREAGEGEHAVERDTSPASFFGFYCDAIYDYAIDQILESPR
jgi:hypothetical protein